MAVLSFSLCVDWEGSIRMSRPGRIKCYLEAGQGYQFHQGNQFGGIQTACNNLILGQQIQDMQRQPPTNELLEFPTVANCN
jgi:hypothetical protein